MDEQGNILIKRLCKTNVYVKSTNQEDNAIGPEIIRNSQGALEHEKPGKVRDLWLSWFWSVCWISFMKYLLAKASKWVNHVRGGVLTIYLLLSIKKKRKKITSTAFSSHTFSCWFYHYFIPVRIHVDRETIAFLIKVANLEQPNRIIRGV